MSLIVHNPHSVLAAMQTRPGDVVSVQLAARSPGGAWADVERQARELRIPVGIARPQRPQRRRGGDPQAKSGRSGASSATIRERQEVSLKDLFEGPLDPDATRGVGSQLFLALDCLQDPHNVGAIFRTAAFFGVAGIVLTKDRSAPMNATVYDVASGGIEYVPFSVQTNLSRALKTAKDSDVWTLGTSERAETDFRDIPRDRRWLLILGNEETGMRRLTADHCDMLCSITPDSPVSSLNVSVASGILIARFSAPPQEST